ncbi:MAG: Sec-independent protein translocase protein TatB [Alphaproteobacteria bacterium]|jgi:sec-independent protein translocase protein TatB|nr:Sec-independent protein translocase protein TatB [Alphaproteobacteria bacterium]MDP6565397.1 Sec-independent protein translocase protein TatB [Alphaproteobacteria bacterium]MDP6814076.1 Sec-independent protein translocase protein TatB [Alphaproteobacteria bacterium]
MLDIGWSEMLMIAVVAIVVIGPRELPRTLRTIGQWIAKARSITREFQSSINDMIAESELDDIRKSADKLRSFDPEDYANEQLDPTGPTDLAGPTAPPHSLEPPKPEGEPAEQAGEAASEEQVADLSEPRPAG